MVQQAILLPDDGEEIGVLGQVVRHAGGERRVAQVGTVERRDRHEGREAQRRRRRVDVLLVDLQLLDEHAADALGDAHADLESHARAEAAPPHLAIDDRQQVVSLVLEDVDVHVARDAERVTAEDLHAREQVVEVGGDELFEGQELRGGAVRHRGAAFENRAGDEARQALGHLDAREAAVLRLGIARLDGQRQREVREERERVPRIDGQRREDGEDRAPEVLPRRATRVGVEALPLADVQAPRRERRDQILGEQLRRRLALLADEVADARELVARRQPVGGRVDDVGLELIVQPRDADHEELVEVRRVDREELHALEERPPRALRLGQHAPVEGEPRQLAIEV